MRKLKALILVFAALESSPCHVGSYPLLAGGRCVRAYRPPVHGGYTEGTQLRSPRCDSNVLSGRHAAVLHGPDVGTNRIVFAYADDLWLISRAGGPATLLSTPPGRKGGAKFSPDGRTVAFTASYGGHEDIYTIPVEGGPLTRVTYYPDGNWLVGWTPDGRLLFEGPDLPFLPPRLFTVPAQGGLRTRLPVPYGIDGAISPDGQWLAYTPNTWQGAWKRYQGGYARDIWLFHLHTHRSKRITTWRGTDSSPMWHGAHLYYLSDAGPEHRMNLWTYDTRIGRHVQITHFADHEVRDPSIGPGPNGRGEIVFLHGIDLCLLDLATHDWHPVPVQLPEDRRSVRPRTVDVGKSIASVDISPGGEQAVVEARGDIWTVPVSSGSPRNLTRTSGLAERDPAWSPDGRWIAYFSDATGEYELYVTAADGGGEARKLTSVGPGFRYHPLWSPDSGRIAFTDHTGAIYLYTLSTQETKRIVVDPLAVDPMSDPPQLSWSPDSCWLAYTKTGQNRLWALWLYNIVTGQARQVTSGRFRDTLPTFDRRGDYLFFVSARDFSSPASDGIYKSTFDLNFVYPNPDLLLGVPLRREIGLPWAHTRAAHSDAAAAGNADGLGRSGTPDGPRKPLSIDLEDFERRAFRLPIPAGRISRLAVTLDNRLIFTLEKSQGETSIRILDLADPTQEAKTILSGSGDFQLAANGARLLVRNGGVLAVVEAAPGQKIDKPIDLAGMHAVIDLRAEWRQIFADVWRLYRDFFYDPHMHRVDWRAMRTKYAGMIDGCATRDDVNDVLNEMIGELSASHSAAYGGDSGRDAARSDPVSVGMLGVDFALEKGAYRIARIYEGAPWDVDARNPLRQVDVNVREGDFLLAVNGTPLDTRKDPWAAFQGLAGRTVALTVSDRPAIDAAARTVEVALQRDDFILRYRASIEHNRAYVDRQTGGKVGYIYVPDTGAFGGNELSRQLYAQMNRAALIIDERWNRGGRTPDRFIELLHRPLCMYWSPRDGVDQLIPFFSHQGPRCLLINGMSVSGGEAFPYGFRKAGLGKLVGTRTRGGLLSLRDTPSLIDGGQVVIPTWGFYDPEGRWVIEGEGVEPDVTMVDDPALMVNGGDPQLDAAIRLMLGELRRHPYQPPRRPAYPDRTGMGPSR